MRTRSRARSPIVPARSPRRQAVASLLGSFLTSTAFVTGYFVLPVSSSYAMRTVVVLVAGLAILGALFTWQVRAIIAAPYPAAKAIGALMVSAPLFLVLFASVYFVLGARDPSEFSEPLTRLDSLYFTVTIFATVGFGDITAVSGTARALTLVQMVGDLLLVGVIARVILGAVEKGRRRQEQR